MKHFFCRSNLLLILAAFIWGGAFVAQEAGMDHIGPWTFCCVRFLIAVLTLLVMMPLLDHKRTHVICPTTCVERKLLLKSCVLCGVAMAVGSVIQQFAITSVPVAKAGFLTTLYVLIVPLLTFFLGKKIQLKIWIGIVIALIGLYLLSMSEDLSLGIGEILLIVCASIFAVHILMIGHYSILVDPVRLSCGQFLIGAAATFVPMLVFEKPSAINILHAYIPLLYTGVLSSCVAYTLQIFAQKEADPTIAGMLMSMESVFAAVTGYLLLGQVLNGRELLGCIFILAAIVVAQLPDRMDMVNVSK